MEWSLEITAGEITVVSLLSFILVPLSLSCEIEKGSTDGTRLEAFGDTGRVRAVKFESWCNSG